METNPKIMQMFKNIIAEPTDPTYFRLTSLTKKPTAASKPFSNTSSGVLGTPVTVCPIFKK